MATCKGTRKDGTACRANALPGGEFCTFHAPDLAAKRAEGRRKGGLTQRAAVLPLPDPEQPLETVGDVVRALSDTIHRVREGRVDVRVANAVAILGGVLLRAIEIGQLESRLTALEEEQARQQPRRPRIV